MVVLRMLICLAALSGLMLAGCGDDVVIVPFVEIVDITAASVDIIVGTTVTFVSGVQVHPALQGQTEFTFLTSTTFEAKADNGDFTGTVTYGSCTLRIDNVDFTHDPCTITLTNENVTVNFGGTVGEVNASVSFGECTSNKAEILVGGNPTGRFADCMIVT